MGPFFICRYIIKVYSDPVPEEFWISKEEWIAYASQSDDLIEARLVNDFIWDFDEYFIKYKGKVTETFIDLAPNGSVLTINIIRPHDALLVQCYKIAQDLNAFFLEYRAKEFPKSKILAAQQKLALKNGEKEIEYQSDSFGDNNIWMTIRGEPGQVAESLGLHLSEMSWDDALNAMHQEEGLFIYAFKGWTFLAGSKVNLLLERMAGKKDLSDKLIIQQLEKLGAEYTDVQYYMYFDRSTYINAFYRVLQGSLFYGEYETEEGKKKHGRTPKIIKDISSGDANNVAAEWSYSPDSLRYYKESKEANVWLGKF